MLTLPHDTSPMLQSSVLHYSLYSSVLFLFFFFNDTATTEIYTLSLHDALPISLAPRCRWRAQGRSSVVRRTSSQRHLRSRPRSEEHTSELQSQSNLVCRLLLEKKKKSNISEIYSGAECVVHTSRT